MNEVQGWFTWEWLYDWAARNVAPSAHTPIFVEVGVWKGASLIHLCKALQSLGRTDARVYAVDTWSMEPVGEENDLLNEYFAELRAAGTNLWSVYRENLVRAGVAHMVTNLRMPSLEAAELIDAADFVFIDADHSTPAVAADVEAWRPKTGVLAGHDVGQPSVARGLFEVLGDRYHTLYTMNCWTTCDRLAAEWKRCWDEEALALIDAVKSTLGQEISDGRDIVARAQS